MGDGPSDIQLIQGITDRLRSEFRDDLREFKNDILREIKGTDTQIEDIRSEVKALSARIGETEMALKSNTKRWSASAIAVTTSLIMAVVAELGIIVTLIH